MREDEEVALTDPYGVAAVHWDHLHVGPRSAALVSFFADLAPPGGHALEIGPGTGRMTLAVAGRAASVHCLEPSPGMRAVLMTKLAGRPDLRQRVTVLAGAAPDFPLGRRFDYVYLAAVLQDVPPRARRALFAGLAGHLVPGGVLAMDMVTDEAVPDHPERELRGAHQGECRYTLSSAVRPLGPDLAGVRRVYRTYHRDTLVATETVEGDYHLHRPAGVLADLRAAGLTAVGGSVVAGEATPLDDKGTLVARL
ncbi:class I SAM-dependent methyltransferase [Nonomuraea angiospora]|uniref:class I SAM-dependent methyltransferase n=1 Tax=Nonomuraea angiospora TaxID=46172 RepID=UPI0029B81D81|nr:class I SAM-dependent methyltransferase [Nonomuraea angiospora]MDX3110787.1 class I SAM-dependent methyltransferase [Nonomuraea angiospora]